MSTLDNGTKLGKYLIVRHLGSGGMADVYEAEDSHLGRRVALKVLPPELARNPQFIQRFESEVRKAASLNHGGIVPVFDFGFDNGTHYYSMRLLTHGSLRNRIDDGLTDAEALTILRDIADALGHAHSRQPPLVHRDVKPENILFDEQGHALLTDFGIAKAMDGNQNLTATGVAIGSALYMSPEQARGKKDVDGRADLYSLGALFYEMLMGVPPYEGEDQISIILKHVTEPIPQLPDKFAQYQSLLDAMMAKNPAQRVASARDLVGLIEARMPPRPTRSTPGARTTGQTQTAAFLVGNGSDAALLADQQRQRDELLAQSQRDAEAARQRAQAAARQAEEDALNKLLETQRLEREKAAAQQAAEQQRLREEREQAERRAAEQARARAEAEAKQKAEEAAREQQRIEAERLAREKASAEAAAAEKQRIAAEARAEAARKAEEARARAEAEAKQKAEEEARRQQAESERQARERAEAEKAAELQRLREEQAREARRIAEERIRAEAQARRQAEEEARRQQAEAEALFEREMAAAMEAEQQRISEEQEAAARKAAEAKRKAEEEVRREQLEAERVEREKAAAVASAAEQKRLQDERDAAARKAEALAQQKAEEETRRQQKLEAQRLEREQSAAAAAEQKRLREEAEAAKRREKEEAAASKQAEDQARKDAAAKAKAFEQARAEQARDNARLEKQRAASQEAEAERQKTEAARREQEHGHDDDVTVIRRLPDRTVPRPSEVETLELPPAGPDLRAPKRATPEARPRPAATSTAIGGGAARQAIDRGRRFLNDMPRKQLLITAAAGALVLAVAAGLIWNGSGEQRMQSQVEAAFANPAEALPAATLDMFPRLDEADRNALLVPGGAVERYFLARSEAAFTVEPLSDDRVAALTMLRKANQELFPRPSKALTDRIDALSEPLYQLLDSVDGKTPFSLSAEEPSVLQVLRQLVLAGDEKRLEKRFRSELLRKFEAALAAARKKDLIEFERLLGDLEIVYGADPSRRDAVQKRLDEAGDPEPAVVTPTAKADDEKALAASEQLVEAAIAANKLDDARSEVLKLRKADKLGSDRGKALADKVARKYAEQAKAEIEAASILKETSAAFELKAALLAGVRQLSRRVDITGLQAQQHAKAELILGRELADKILGGAALKGEQGVQASLNLDLALGQLDAAPKSEREALKGQLTKALEKMRGAGVSAAAPAPPAAAPVAAAVPPPTGPASPPLSGNDPCATQKACTDTVGGQTLRSYRLGAAAPYDRLFLQEQEVSGELYSIVMGTGMTAAPRLPVTGVSVDDAKRFAEKLSTQTRHKFRLPTATEWQLAAKEIRPAVLATANCANGGGRLNNVEKPIGQAKGAVNIIGNAAEIVADGGGYRVAGASFRDAGADCSPDSLKAYAGPDAATGFRLVRVVE